MSDGLQGHRRGRLTPQRCYPIPGESVAMGQGGLRKQGSNPGLAMGREGHILRMVAAS